MPPPKDLKKLAEYKEKMSKIAKEKGYGKWMIGKEGTRLGKKHTKETIQKLKIINKENAIKFGYGKWMKGRKLPHISESNIRRLSNKTYEEIYGKDKGKIEADKRKISNRIRWNGKKKNDVRLKHNADYHYVE